MNASLEKNIYILDDVIPNIQTSFRLAEFNYYLKKQCMPSRYSKLSHD